MTKYIKGQPIEITVSGTVAADYEETPNGVLVVLSADGERVLFGQHVLTAADSIDLGPVPVTLPTEPGIYVHEDRGLTPPLQRTEDNKWFKVPMAGGAERRVFMTDRAVTDAIRVYGPIVKVA